MEYLIIFVHSFGDGKLFEYFLSLKQKLFMFDCYFEKFIKADTYV